MKKKKMATTPDMETTYDEQANLFAEHAKKLITWLYGGRLAVDKHLGNLYGTEARIFDQGSASARLEEHFIANGIPPKGLVGIEISSKQVDIARNRVPEPAVFIHGDIREVAFPDEGTYDAGVSHMVYEFLDPDGLASALGHAYNALKPGGRFLVVVTHPEKMTASDGVSERGWFKTGAPWGGEVDNWFRPTEDYLAAMEAAGFNVEAVDHMPIPDDAQEYDEALYEKYKKYPYIRLAILASKAA
jgi:SAM-dependent methyltransferase